MKKIISQQQQDNKMKVLTIYKLIFQKKKTVF
jgi:hypothetical protein